MDKLLAEKIKEFSVEKQPTWCGGCGNYGIWTAIKMALVELGYSPFDVFMFFDIGCNGNMNDKIEGYRFHGLHGRVLPAAIGAKLANKDMLVIAIGGDGATYSEGIGHFIHSIRNEYPITFIVNDNSNYGLTTGQCSSTTRQGYSMNGSVDGNSGKTLNPLELALSLDPSFVAQAFSGYIDTTKEVIKMALKHQIENKGFSFVNLLQSCPTYNKATPQEWYMQRVKELPELISEKVGDIEYARNLVKNTDDKIPVGLIYRNAKSESFTTKVKLENLYKQNDVRTIENILKLHI